MKVNETLHLQGKSGFGVRSFPRIGLIIGYTLRIVEQHEVTAMPLLEDIFIALLKKALANDSSSLVLDRSLRKA